MPLLSSTCHRRAHDAAQKDVQRQLANTKLLLHLESLLPYPRRQCCYQQQLLIATDGMCFLILTPINVTITAAERLFAFLPLAWSS